MAEEENLLSIGELSKLSDYSVQALRYYADMGLIECERKASGYRYFKKNQLKNLYVITAYKASGFKLSEILQMMKLDRTSSSYCDEMRELLLEKKEKIKEEIKTLKKAKQFIRCNLGMCDKCTKDSCLIIDISL